MFNNKFYTIMKKIILFTAFILAGIASAKTWYVRTTCGKEMTLYTEDNITIDELKEAVRDANYMNCFTRPTKVIVYL